MRNRSSSNNNKNETLTNYTFMHTHTHICFCTEAKNKSALILTNENTRCFGCVFVCSVAVCWTAWHVLQFCFEFYCVSFRLILPIYSFLSFGNRRMKKNQKRKYKISSAQSKFESDLLPKSIFLLTRLLCTQCLLSMDGFTPHSSMPYTHIPTIYVCECVCLWFFLFCVSWHYVPCVIRCACADACEL